ncbi:hypothetical protein [Pseudonocardia sp. ICBG601]|uniref:hypothetical protein n=1 Tax=Pseudonocardia sp. ICBG601 TaxID=2846759 RepID=UPI001CF6B47E|nr:hypothetical protein [Pseudonocardia sp. ICBG601]
MKALVLGARGAVGRAVVAELGRTGETAVPAGRTRPDGGVAIDLSSGDGLSALHRVAADVDVVVNASGVERPELAARVGATPLVEISATGRYLERLGRRATGDGAGVLLGAGLVPGLSTIMASATADRPGDAIDVMVMLGSGEAHGAAAVEWTSRLLGTTIHAAPEAGPVRNLRSWRRAPVTGGRVRRHLRADFPDHVLIGRARQQEIRTYLALSSPVATAALAAVAHVPRLRGILARAPHLGSSRWHLSTTNRRTGRTLRATGEGQSHATGVLAALAARRMAADPPTMPVTMDRVISWPEALDLLAPRGNDTGNDLVID